MRKMIAVHISVHYVASQRWVWKPSSLWCDDDDDDDDGDDGGGGDRRDNIFSSDDAGVHRKDSNLLKYKSKCR